MKQTLLALACCFGMLSVNAQNDPSNLIGDTGTVTFKYRGLTTTYVTVRAADGKVWLQQNLGSTAVATSKTDANGYGHLFQWGRWDDAHQLTNSALALGSSLSPNNPSGIFAASNLFYRGNNPADWWSGGNFMDTWTFNPPSNTNGTDPCTKIGPGWHLPSQGEWGNVITLESINNTGSAFSSNLKLTAAGSRDGQSGNLINAGMYGNYWSQTPNGPYAKDLTILDNSVNNNDDALRSYGMSVRCMTICTGVFAPDTVTGPLNVCPESMVTYTTVPVSNANSYIWTLPPGWTIIGPATGISVNVRAGTIAGLVTAQATNTCGTGNGTFLTPTMLPQPMPVINRNANTLSTTSFTTYQWMRDGQLITGATSQNYTATQNGIYKVIASNAAGCKDTSDEFEILNVGILNVLANYGVRLYPNPVVNELHIDAPFAVDAAIFDPQGRMLVMQVNAKTLELKALPAGIYYVRITGAGGQLYGTEQFIKTE